MANGFRSPLGLGLQNLLTPPTNGVPQFSQAPLREVAPPKQGGFLGEGGMGRILAGAIGDGLLQNAGMQPVYAPMQQQKQRMAQEEIQWNRRRQSEREDKQWEWQNKPQSPYRFQDNAGNLVELGADGKPRTLFTDPTPKINYQRVNNPDGTFTMVPMPVGGTPASAALPAIGAVMADPRKMGGGSGNATGGFQR